jgi:hypothetical protein
MAISLAKRVQELLDVLTAGCEQRTDEPWTGRGIRAGSGIARKLRKVE